MRRNQLRISASKNCFSISMVEAEVCGFTAGVPKPPNSLCFCGTKKLMSTRIRFLLPLPPSVNNQYRDADIGGVTRRVLSAEAKHWKTSIARAFHTLLVQGRLPDSLMDDAQKG